MKTNFQLLKSRLMSFKQEHSGTLPGQSGGYYIKLNNQKEELKAIELQILESKTRLDSAKKQLSQSIVADTGSDNKIKSESSIQTTYDARINELEVRLDTLKLRYTDKHPDVIEISRNLEHLNQLRSTEIENYLTQNSENTDSLKRLSANPVVQEVQIQIKSIGKLNCLT